MGAAELLQDLHSAGIRVSVDGENLVLRPAGKMQDGLREAVLKAKPELMRLLAHPGATSTLNSSVPSAQAWSAQDIQRYLARNARLIRWGWAEEDAADVAERLTRRDQDETDLRRACVECIHYAPRGQCSRHRAAQLASGVIGPDLATLLQRCPAHDPVIHTP
jgi:hypothetical protein